MVVTMPGTNPAQRKNSGRAKEKYHAHRRSEHRVLEEDGILNQLYKTHYARTGQVNFSRTQDSVDL